MHRLLSADQFQATFLPPMREVTASAEPVVDLWAYVDTLPLEPLAIEAINDVVNVYHASDGRYEHVVLGTSRFNTMMVVVVDRFARVVVGHRLLDLNAEYGVSGNHLRSID